MKTETAHKELAAASSPVGVVISFGSQKPGRAAGAGRSQPVAQERKLTESKRHSYEAASRAAWKHGGINE